MYYRLLYYTILYYTILYYTILYYTILYYTILYYTILYYTILYYTILYYTILYYTIQGQSPEGPNCRRSCILLLSVASSSLQASVSQMVSFEFLNNSSLRQQQLALNLILWPIWHTIVYYNKLQNIIVCYSWFATFYYSMLVSGLGSGFCRVLGLRLGRRLGPSSPHSPPCVPGPSPPLHPLRPYRGGLETPDA